MLLLLWAGQGRAEQGRAGQGVSSPAADSHLSTHCHCQEHCWQADKPYIPDRCHLLIWSWSRGNAQLPLATWQRQRHHQASADSHGLSRRCFCSTPSACVTPHVYQPMWHSSASVCMFVPPRFAHIERHACDMAVSLAVWCCSCLRHTIFQPCRHVNMSEALGGNRMCMHVLPELNSHILQIAAWYTYIIPDMLLSRR